VNSYMSIVPLTAFCVYVVLIALAFRQGVRGRVTQLFVWYISLLTIWAFFSFMVYANFSFVDVHLWNSLLVVFLLTSAVAFFHFVRALLGKPEPRLWLSLGYGSCIVVAVAAFMGYTVDFAYWSGGEYHMRLGIATYAMTPISIAFVNASIFNLFQARRATKDPFTRNRVTYPLVGMSIYAVLSLTNFLPGWKWYPVDQGGNLINAGLVASAVLMYRLIDIQIAFRRGLLYSLQTLILGGVFFGIGLALFAGFGGWDLIRWVPGIIIALLVAIVIPQVYRLTRRWIDRLFVGEEHDYPRTLRAISGAMSAMPDLGDQASWLMNNVMKTVQAAKGGYSYWMRSKSGMFSRR